MNALKKYNERRQEAHARKIVNDNLDSFIEHMDLLTLYVLYAEFGFRDKRLHRFFDAIVEYYKYFRDRFIKPGDEYRFWSPDGRMDTFAIKSKLKEAGFDYDAAVKAAEDKEEA